MIERAERDGITIVRLAHGKVNALDVELAAAIVDTFVELAATPHRAVVLTGSGSAFSAGVDLRRLTAEGPDYAKQLVGIVDDSFEVVFRHPAPVVAAINGHAIAGGCVLASACDRRLMAEGDGRIGVPELMVGVPFPAAALEVMRFAVGASRLPALLLETATYDPAAAVAAGLVDEVVDAPQLLDRAVTVAAELSGDRIPASTFRVTKRQLRRDAIDAMGETRPLDADAIVARWSDPETIAWIEAYMAKATGRR